MATILKFINRSAQGHRLTIVVFAHNVVRGADPALVAWQVIRCCGRDSSRTMVYTGRFEVDVSDWHGNFTPRLALPEGGGAALAQQDRRRLLVPNGGSPRATIQIGNGLRRGAVDANVHIAGALLATWRGIVPGQRARFLFRPMLFIAISEGARPGKLLPPGGRLLACTALKLARVASADIVLSDQGAGGDVAGYRFKLQRVVNA